MSGQNPGELFDPFDRSIGRGGINIRLNMIYQNLKITLNKELNIEIIKGKLLKDCVKHRSQLSPVNRM